MVASPEDDHDAWSISLALVLFLAVTAIARADPPDDFIKAEMKRQNIPGLSLAIGK